MIELDGRVLLTDPLLTERLYSIRRICPVVDPGRLPKIDLVLISHLHHDHCHPQSLRGLRGSPTFLTPHGGGDFLARNDVGPAIEAGPGDRFEFLDLRIDCLPANHSGERVPFGPHAAALAFEIIGSRRIYFVGDTGYFEPMRTADQPLDVALLPVSGWGDSLGPGHLDPDDAARAARQLGPRWVVPIHWGAYKNAIPVAPRVREILSPAQQLVVALEGDRAGIQTAVLRPGTTDRLVL